MTANILVVEDEEHLARGLKFNLEAEGYKTRRRRRRRDSARPAASSACGVRPAGARRHAAGQRRIHRGHRASPGQPVHSAPDADRARSPGRCAQGLRGRRGRLSAQAVRPEHSVGAHPEPVAPSRLESSRCEGGASRKQHPESEEYRRSTRLRGVCIRRTPGGLCNARAARQRQDLPPDLDGG